MSLLSSIKKTASTVAWGLKTVYKAHDYRLNTVARYAVQDALTGKGVSGTTGIKPVDKVLTKAASNPYTTAAVVTPVNTGKAVIAGFKALPVAGKITTVAATPAIIAYSAQNPKSIGKVAEAPRKIASAGSDLGDLTKNPSVQGVIDYAKEHPVITGGLGLIAATTTAKGAGAAASALNAYETRQNTKEISKGTVITLPAASAASSPQTASIVGSPGASPSPFTAPTQALTPSTTYRRKRRASLASQQINRQSVSVRVYNNSRVQSFIRKRKR